jgi:hypothetical protein
MRVKASVRRAAARGRRRSDDPAPDGPVAPDDEGLGHAGRLVLLSDAAWRVVEDLEAEVQLVGESVDLRLHPRIVHTHRDDAKPLGTEALLEPFHARHLDTAGAAPRGPDVEQHHLAGVVAHTLLHARGLGRRRPRRQRDRLEVRRIGADRQREELIAQRRGRRPEARRHEGDRTRDDEPLVA